MHQTTLPQLNQIILDLNNPEQIQHAELILCRFCHAAITTRRDEYSISGNHQHRFLNPHGYQYHIGCFSVAPGCDITGPVLDHYTWFKGYAWQLARCTDCGEHLGWLYQSGETHQFFGLIIDKLVRFQTR